MSTEKHVNAILDRTFKVLQAVYESQTETNSDFLPSRMSRIIFPKKRNTDKRVSEQELRFIFVEQLNEEIKQGWDVYYSVETPTKKDYSGFSKGKPECGKGGRSGSIDLVIHDNTSKRHALVEFKAHDAKVGDYEKDICKLENEESEYKFFVNVLENVDGGTFKNIFNVSSMKLIV